jgi:uncharacterized membrane protein (UPF0127 family)
VTRRHGPTQAGRSLGWMLLSAGLVSTGLAGPALLAPLGNAARAQNEAPPLGAPQQLPVTAQWCLAPQRCIQLEVATTPRQQALGLQLRAPLPPLRGMWFPFRQPTPTRFWMHRTPAPLDMLFIADGQVVAIEAGALPCPPLPCPSYGPDVPVEGVLELAAGQAAALGISLGRPVRIEPLPGADAASDTP